MCHVLRLLCKQSVSVVSCCQRLLQNSEFGQPLSAIKRRLHYGISCPLDLIAWFEYITRVWIDFISKWTSLFTIFSISSWLETHSNGPLWERSWLNGHFTFLPVVPLDLHAYRSLLCPHFSKPRTNFKICQLGLQYFALFPLTQWIWKMWVT